MNVLKLTFAAQEWKQDIFQDKGFYSWDTSSLLNILNVCILYIYFKKD